MKDIKLDKKFQKQLSKLDKKIIRIFNEKYNKFLVDEFFEGSNNHKLRPPYEGKRSINITGDFRLIYEKTGENSFVFVELGTHSELYE